MRMPYSKFNVLLMTYVRVFVNFNAKYVFYLYIEYTVDKYSKFTVNYS